MVIVDVICVVCGSVGGGMWVRWLSKYSRWLDVWRGYSLYTGCVGCTDDEMDRLMNRNTSVMSVLKALFAYSTNACDMTRRCGIQMHGK